MIVVFQRGISKMQGINAFCTRLFLFYDVQILGFNINIINKRAPQPSQPIVRYQLSRALGRLRPTSSRKCYIINYLAHGKCVFLRAVHTPRSRDGTDRYNMTIVFVSFVPKILIGGLERLGDVRKPKIAVNDQKRIRQ